MANWEDTFRSWAKGPGKTEQEKCENAIRAIKNAIDASNELKNRKVEVFLQGSYRNRVNVRQDSDVDVGVVAKSVFFSDYPDGTNRTTFGNKKSAYKYSRFKNDVENALVKRFGRASVTRSNKAFDIKSNTYRVEADVAPFFEHRRYSREGTYEAGVELLGVGLLKDNGGKVINYPEQHYEKGVWKNGECNRRYKGLVRILKKLAYEMASDGVSEAKDIPGFLCECLVWNVPNHIFGHEYYSDDLRQAIIFLYDAIGKAASDEWGEVSELKYLFRESQPWTKEQSNAFLAAAWNYVGFG